jgi:hypothetical protein
MDARRSAMSEIDDRERRSLLKDEYLLLQNHYEDFDRRSLTIKGWIAAGAVTALAISFGSSFRYAWVLPILVAVLAAAFWYIEAYWKLFQSAIGDRIRIIEAYFRADSKILLDKVPTPFQAYHRFYRSYVFDEPLYWYEIEQNGRPRTRSKRLWRLARQSFVYQPYATIIVLSAAAFMILLLTNR